MVRVFCYASGMNAQELKQRYEQLRPTLKLDEVSVRLKELKELTAKPDLWSNQEEAVALTSEQAALEKQLDHVSDVETLLELLEDLTEADLQQLEQEIRALEAVTLLAGAHDAQGALVSIHAGTGGTDAMDWAQMLERMYLRFVEAGSTELPERRILGIDRSSWKAELVDRREGEEAGVKEVVFQVTGRYAYGLLKGEAGVHRLVRISPFGGKDLRQTSFALVQVVPMLPASETPKLSETELQIDVYRAGGAGGQHVNTTNSAVRITHIPTGLVVAVQNERSQHQNKAVALSILASKLARLQETKDAQELAALKGEFKEGTWGNQIRSYVLQPYQMVKDLRTQEETSDVQTVLDGGLKPFLEAQLYER